VPGDGRSAHAGAMRASISPAREARDVHMCEGYPRRGGGVNGGQVAGADSLADPRSLDRNDLSGVT
jgi:hypothetical protein